ncbi:hypothetical protein EDC04DRAFT_2800120 [Pisolithus marmoratus]|nr:hypothetical protein EDC04DRAFT_2800120 [Pisolithus marmoratus]
MPWFIVFSWLLLAFQSLSGKCARYMCRLGDVEGPLSTGYYHGLVRLGSCKAHDEFSGMSIVPSAVTDSWPTKSPLTGPVPPINASAI